MEDMIKEIQREILMLKVKRHTSEVTGISSFTGTNSFIGTNAGKDSTGEGNTAYGNNSLAGERNGPCTGSYNTAYGDNSLKDNNTGHSNCAYGQSSLLFNLGGTGNCAYGYFSSRSNTDGHNNCSYGKNAGSGNTYRNGNVAFGADTLSSCIASNNTAVGFESCKSLVSDTDNLTYSEKNTAFGSQSLKNAVNCSNITCIGYETDIHQNSREVWLNNSTAIGFGATITQSSQIVLGNGDISQLKCNANLEVTSDRRLKENIEENVSGLSFITRLRPVTYNFIGKDKIRTGLIAQEVEEVLDGYDFDGITIPKNETENYSLSYATFVVPLIKAVQEQQVIIEELRKEIEFLKNK